MERIRDAAKWLIAASAAVGAVLIAGSQLSSIGQLDLGRRLYAAIGGVALALMAVVFAMWVAVQVLRPIGVTLKELQDHWAANDRADVKFFHKNPGQLGYSSPTDLRTAREQAWQEREDKRVALDAASGEAARKTAQEQFDAADDEYERINSDVLSILQNAQYQLLQDKFNKTLWKLLAAAVLAAGGIMVFAWAANPPKPPSVTTSLRNAHLIGADLRDANLAGADLTGADLTDANLRGADLSNAVVKDVTWLNTTCPDGTNSDDAGKTCRGHL